MWWLYSKVVVVSTDDVMRNLDFVLCVYNGMVLYQFTMLLRSVWALTNTFSNCTYVTTPHTGVGQRHSAELHQCISIRLVYQCISIGLVYQCISIGLVYQCISIRLVYQCISIRLVYQCTCISVRLVYQCISIRLVNQCQ